jgi:TolA-binding protein
VSVLPRRASFVRGFAVALAFVLGQVAHVRADDVPAIEREIKDIAGDTDQVRKVPLTRSQLRSATHVEERLADGELFLRLGDYVRASVILSDIADNYTNHRAHPDASFLLGEALFKAKDFLGARKRYAQIIERADQPLYGTYAQRSLGRLIEIAIRIRDFEGVDAYFTRLAQLPSSQVDAATTYFKAKYHYSLAVRDGEDARGQVDAARLDAARAEQARAGFAAVGAQSEYHAPARYFIGVLQVLSGKLPEAIATFRYVAKLAPKTEEQRRVVELAKLAVGRLNYELDQLGEAIDAYESIPRMSPLFDTALYELAWVYIRMGDSTRAEQALEVLSVAAPDSKHIPDGKLLRANLLLRDGLLKRADEVFEEVARQFEPVREKLDQRLAAHEDTLAFFKQLVRDNLEVFDAAAFLPPEAERWASSEGEMERAMDTLSDLSQCRQLVRETTSLVQRLDAALSVPTPVAVFRDLRAHRERTLVLRNRLAVARKRLSAMEEKATARLSSAELTQVRTRRREIERSLSAFPVDQDAIDARAMASDKVYAKLAKQLNGLSVELLGMEARVIATERYLDAAKRDDATANTVRTELVAQRTAVTEYRRQIEALNAQVETARLQVGIGDRSFAVEAGLRSEHTALVTRERALLASLGARSEPRVDAGFQRIGAIEASLDAHDRAVDAVVAERIREMRIVIDEERIKLDGYRARLVELEANSEDVVGGVALANYQAVRQRFYELVLRADVGSIDVAWATREEHRMRAEQLTRERLRVLKGLEDEYREILDQKESQ